jgi:signal transduction histidine kinase
VALAVGVDEPGLLEVLEADELEEVLRAAVQPGAPLWLRLADGSTRAPAGVVPGTAAHASPIVVGGRTLAAVEVGGGADAARADAVAGELTVLARIGAGRRATLERLRAELADRDARLVQAAEKVKDVDRVKSNFLATVSHELRTPLTSVIGYSEMLLEGMAGAINAEQRDYVETILAKADQLLQMITGLLEVARMDAGTLNVDRRPVPIQDIIRRAATSLASEADRRAVALTLPTSPVPRVLGDSRKLRQVVTHLLANAIKFTPSGGDVVVETSVGPLSPSDRNGHLGVRVSVRDTGIGIPLTVQSHIFEPFYQVDQSSTREYGGTGLGLSLAKSYVEAHGGMIWVNSHPGQGATFTVSLPAVPEDLAAYAGATTAASANDDRA